jgi:hypothetical protein
MPVPVPGITLGDPVVVSRGPAGLTRWGPWQFPAIERLADGRLHVTFHVEADSATAYGLPVGHAVSADEGQTWQSISAAPETGGLLLANGDRLRAVALRSRPAAGLILPQPIADWKGSYGGAYNVFALDDLAADLRDGWRFARCRAGQTQWQEETARVELPGEVRYTTEDVFTFPWMWRMRLAPDGSLWGMYYGFHAPHRRLNDKWSTLLLRSTDNGHSWSLQSEILYHADAAADPGWANWDGFTEPNIGFLPDGSFMCLLRTTDGHGIGPLYSCFSIDNGLTWSRPRVFDDRGVWPAVVELANGWTLASYGRPGLFVRATMDPAGRVWGNRVAVVEPKQYQTDTCSYSDMIPLGDGTAMIAYSDFQYPDAAGDRRKTILVRRVIVTPQ